MKDPASRERVPPKEGDEKDPPPLGQVQVEEEVEADLPQPEEGSGCGVGPRLLGVEGAGEGGQAEEGRRGES